LKSEREQAREEKRREEKRRVGENTLRVSNMTGNLSSLN
jgi:hypothetical protein